MPKLNDIASLEKPKRKLRNRHAMTQLVTARKKGGKSHYNITCATNESLYLLINLEAMMEGKSVSAFLEDILMARYGDRIGNFKVAFENLRNLEGR